jgi:hypothetical protein
MSIFEKIGNIGYTHEFPVCKDCPRKLVNSKPRILAPDESSVCFVPLPDKSEVHYSKRRYDGSVYNRSLNRDQVADQLPLLYVEIEDCSGPTVERTDRKDLFGRRFHLQESSSSCTALANTLQQPTQEAQQAYFENKAIQGVLF